MRIAVVTTSFPANEADPSGHFVRAHVTELEASGHAVVVVAPVAGGAFGWPGVQARLRERPLRVLDAARWVSRSVVRLSTLRVDRVVAHWAVPCAWPIASLNPAPLEVVSHGGDIRLLCALPPHLRNWTIAAILARGERWTFASDALMATLVNDDVVDTSTRARIERIAVVRAPPIEMPDVSEAVAHLRRQLDGRRIAVVVGRLVPSKRVDRAMVYVTRRRELDGLVIVGDGPERSRLERIARESRMNVKFVGNVERPQALAWIGAASELVHASEAEGLSTVIREADALGTPVVRLE